MRHISCTLPAHPIVGAAGCLEDAMMKCRNFGVVLALLLVPASVSAHAVLTYPPPRLGGFAGSNLKMRPCGRGTNDPRSSTVTTLTAGQTITVTWQETIPHPGFFRISFDSDGMDDFVDPPRRAPYLTDSPTVLADNLHPQEPGLRLGQTYSAEITLPNVPCTNCTLQLIQFMRDKFVEGQEDQDPDPNDDIYYSCADIILVEDPNNPPDPDAGVNPGTDAGTQPGTDAGAQPGTDSGIPGSMSDAGMDHGGHDHGGDSGSSSDGGCSVSASPRDGAFGLLLALLGLVAIRRRRR